MFRQQNKSEKKLQKIDELQMGLNSLVYARLGVLSSKVVCDITLSRKAKKL